MTILFIVYIALSFSSLAGVLMEHFATFAGWPWIGAPEFVKVRTVQGLGSLYVYVVPKLLFTALIVVLLARRPAGIPAAPLWISLGLLTVSWAVSALVLVPTQLRLQRGKDLAMVEGLVRRDWVRVAAMLGVEWGGQNLAPPLQRPLCMAGTLASSSIISVQPLERV